MMSFVETLDSLALRKSELIERFEHLIAPTSDRELEAMAQTSRALTLQNFGRTMRLFAPLISFERMHQQLPVLRFLSG